MILAGFELETSISMFYHFTIRPNSKLIIKEYKSRWYIMEYMGLGWDKYVLTILYATLLVCLWIYDITKSKLQFKIPLYCDTRSPNSLWATIEEIRASTILLSVSNKTSCILFKIVILIDSNRAMGSTSRIETEEVRNWI